MAHRTSRLLTWAGLLALVVAGSAAGCATGADDGAGTTPEPTQGDASPTEPTPAPLPPGPPPAEGDGGGGCAAPKLLCDGTCIDVSQNNVHCGDCGTRCSVGQLCSASVCKTPCAPGLTGCGTECVDTTSSVSHCGSCASTCPAMTNACAGGSCVATVSVRAYIDGQSLLVIQGGSLRWHHVRDSAPGLWAGSNEATAINGAGWTPGWPAGGDNHSCNCDSSATTVAPLAARAQTATVGVVAARGTLAVQSQPSAANGFALTVVFDDPPGGADWYQANITYATK